MHGIHTLPVSIEIQISPGLPIFIIVGLGDKAIAESKERVRSAIFALGLTFPAKRIVVNLSPANEPKEGTHYDFGIALSLLVAMQIISYERVKNTIVVGELSLNGDIIAVPGIVAHAYSALKNNMSIIVPSASYKEAIRVSNNVIPASSLKYLIEYLNGGISAQIPYESIKNDDNSDIKNINIDFANIAGHERAKRALEIAVAGGHHICMIGKPGSGKSMLAQAVKSILPSLNQEEMLEISMIHSICGYSFVETRPFRNPHHTSSAVSIIGGGNKCMPGEISLAHLGILFLDELPEFSRHVLESLRQPMEDYRIEIARANYKRSYMAKFQLIAAMNPCYCGSCNDSMCIAKYQRKLSAPLKERFDIAIHVNDFHYTNTQADSSYTIMQRIIDARKKQNNKLNGQLSGPEMLNLSNIDYDAQQWLEAYARKYNLSTRSYFRILRIAMTISHLSDIDTIQLPHVTEALGYHAQWITEIR